MIEHAARQPPEVIRTAFVPDRKPAHGDPVDPIDAGRPLVAPGDVIAGAGRHHLDLRVPREPLGHVARVQLGAAVDVGAVTLDHDRELHELVSRAAFAGIAPAVAGTGGALGATLPRAAPVFSG